MGPIAFGMAASTESNKPRRKSGGLSGTEGNIECPAAERRFDKLRSWIAMGAASCVMIAGFISPYVDCRSTGEAAMNRLILFTLLALLSANASASQFGLEPGASLAEIRKNATLKEEKAYTYSTSKLPNGNAAFDDYHLLVTPQQRL